MASKEYYTYKIETMEEAVTRPQKLEKTFWYSPLLGLVIKSHGKVIEGTNYGQSFENELLSIRYPSEYEKNLHQIGARRLDAKIGSNKDTSPREKLSELKGLFDDGLISKEEYARKKKEILSKF